MNIGKFNSEFTLHGDRDDAKTLFLCEDAMVPRDIPQETIFLSKNKATLSDFTQLFMIYEEEWANLNGDVVIFGLGRNDITKEEKELNLNKVTQEFDFHPVPNKRNGHVLNSFTTLIEQTREFKGVINIVSLDPISKDSSGYHNATVEFISRRVKQVNNSHFHLISSKRLQRNERKRRIKSAGVNFPSIPEKFKNEDELIESEKCFLALVAVRTIETRISSTNVVWGENDFCRRKF